MRLSTIGQSEGGFIPTRTLNLPNRAAWAIQLPTGGWITITLKEKEAEGEEENHQAHHAWQCYIALKANDLYPLLMSE